MVSQIFPSNDLAAGTVDLQRRLCKLHTLAALLIKESVNQTVDNMGFYNALNACFTLHQMNHSHWAEVNDDKYPAGKPEHGVPAWNETPPVVALSKSVADPFATSPSGS
jgi:enoyl-CoA hydratase